MKKGETKFAKNQAELAKILGIDRKAWSSWRRDPKYRKIMPCPTADGRWNIQECKDFMAKSGVASDFRSLSNRSDMIDTRIELERLKVEEKQVKIGLMRGDYVRKSIVQEVFSRNLSKLFTRLQRMLINEMPGQLIGLTEPEISLKLKSTLERIMEDAETEQSEISSIGSV
jgi:hypothetical protein